MNETAYHEILRRLGVEPAGAEAHRGASTPSGPDAAEVARRVVAFRIQFEEWTASGRLGAPVLALPNIGVALGRCVSCAATLAEGRTWRCALCLRAVEVALGFAPPP